MYDSGGRVARWLLSVAGGQSQLQIPEVRGGDVGLDNYNKQREQQMPYVRMLFPPFMARGLWGSCVLITDLTTC